MLRTRVQTAALLILPTLSGGDLRGDPPRDTAAPTVLRAARLLDVRTGNVMTNPVVLLENGRIAAVGRGLAIPIGARVLDLGGAILLPGLVDCHTHLSCVFDPKLSDVANLPIAAYRMSTADRALAGAAMGREMLEAGITTVRDVGNAGHNGDAALRDAIKKGWVAGPRMFVATRGIAPLGGQFEWIQPELQSMIQFEYTTITGEEEGRRAVRQAHYDRADFIKAYSMDRITRAELKAVVDEAHRLNMKVAVHATEDHLIQKAIEAGADSIEHGYRASDESLQRMAKNKVILVPTVFPFEKWEKVLIERGQSGSQPGGMAARYREFVQLGGALVARAQQAGVPIAAGSDMVFILPGMTRGQASLLVFRAYAGAGMTPLQIIQTATINGANLIGIKAQCGSLEKGLYADIIAVSGDPLKDITELERVKFVMKEGAVIRNDLK